MNPGLTIAAVRVPIAATALEAPEHQTGSASRGGDGSLRGTVGQVRRIWTCQTLPMAKDEADWLLGLAKPGRRQLCGGALLGGEAACYVAITGERWVRHKGQPLRVFSLELSEA
jgi:hypothetical protein